MCQSSVYALDSGQQKLLLDEVTRVEVEGDALTIEALFGEPICLKARIKAIDLTKQRILVERI